MSTLLTVRDQVIMQAACLSIPVAGSTLVLRHTLWISGRKEIALATSISCSKYYICYVPRPTCQGSAPLYVPRDGNGYKPVGFCYPKPVPVKNIYTH
jgi:hypothetical protein